MQHLARGIPKDKTGHVPISHLPGYYTTSRSVRCLHGHVTGLWTFVLLVTGSLAYYGEDVRKINDKLKEKNERTEARKRENYISECL